MFLSFSVGSTAEPTQGGEASTLSHPQEGSVRGRNETKKQRGEERIVVNDVTGF